MPLPSKQQATHFLYRQALFYQCALSYGFGEKKAFLNGFGLTLALTGNMTV